MKRGKTGPRSRTGYTTKAYSVRLSPTEYAILEAAGKACDPPLGPLAYMRSVVMPLANAAAKRAGWKPPPSPR